MARTLTIQRSGEFTVRTRGATHCGTTDPLVVRYTFVCVCTVGSLDQRGFLFDQVNVDRMFQTITASSWSCERLTMRCVEELVEQIISENPRCRILRCALTLSPAPFAASITYDRDDLDERPMPRARRRRRIEEEVQ